MERAELISIQKKLRHNRRFIKPHPPCDQLKYQYNYEVWSATITIHSVAHRPPGAAAAATACEPVLDNRSAYTL